MDQKPPQSSDTPPAGTPNSAPASPPQENTQQPSTPPVDHPAEHSTIPAPTNPEQSPSTPEQSTAPSAPTATVSASGAPTPLVPGAPGDPVHKKSHTMMYAVVTLVIVLIGAGLVTMMSMNQEAQPGVNTTVAQPTQAPAPTEVPTVIPSPSTPEEEVEAVNVTENDADLQEVEKDLQAL